jgi:hypothetical protein
MDTKAMLCPNFLLLADKTGMGGDRITIGRISLKDPGDTSRSANNKLCPEYRAICCASTWVHMWLV